jgi:hypothetical protein
VAFVEGGDDVGAVWEVLGCAVGIGKWGKRALLNFFSVQMGMHCGRGSVLVLGPVRRVCMIRLGVACDAVAWSRCWSSFRLIGKS